MTIPSQVQDHLATLNGCGSRYSFEYGRPDIIHLEFRVKIQKRGGIPRSSIRFLWPSNAWAKKWPSDGWTLTHIAKYVDQLCRLQIEPMLGENESVNICFRLSVYTSTIYVGLRKTHSKDTFGPEGSKTL